jgi:hypothetical protein
MESNYEGAVHMDQEKMKVLQMVEEKKITAAEAAKLLDALDEYTGPREEPRVNRGALKGQLLKVKVSDLDTGRARVNLRLPVGIAHIITSLIPDQELKRMEDQGIKVNAIMEAINSNTVGKIFDVEDEVRRAHVEISIE